MRTSIVIHSYPSSGKPSSAASSLDSAVPGLRHRHPPPVVAIELMRLCFAKVHPGSFQSDEQLPGLYTAAFFCSYPAFSCLPTSLQPCLAGRTGLVRTQSACPTKARQGQSRPNDKPPRPRQSGQEAAMPILRSHQETKRKVAPCTEWKLLVGIQSGGGRETASRPPSTVTGWRRKA